MEDALLKPHNGGDSLDHQMANLIAGISGARDGIFEDIMSYSMPNLATVADLAPLVSFLILSISKSIKTFGRMAGNSVNSD